MSRLEEIKTWVRVRQGKHPDDVRWLISRIEELEEELEKREIDQINKHYENKNLINRLKEENKRYKQALDFYADFYKYNYGGDKDAMKQVSKSIITEDGGEVARQALKGESDD